MKYSPKCTLNKNMFINFLNCIIKKKTIGGPTFGNEKEKQKTGPDFHFTQFGDKGVCFIL